MQEQSPSSADTRMPLTRPRFGEEEKRHARPVMPLNEGDVKHNLLHHGPRVAFRGPAWRSLPRHLVVALVLVATAAISTATALYAHFSQANSPVYAQPATQSVAEPVLLPQPPAPRQTRRMRSADVMYAPRGDEKDNEKDDKDGRDSYERNKHWRRYTKGGDEKAFKHDRRVERAIRELRRLGESTDPQR